jgi:hypothetical protein
VAKAFFASADLHQQIAGAAVKSGDEIKVSKVAVQDGRRVIGRLDLEVVSKASPASSENGNGHTPTESADSRFREMMELSLRDAIDATRAVNTVQWDVDSIRAIALTIFIQRARSCVTS